MDIIDVWAQIPTKRFMQERWMSSLLRWTGQDGAAPVPGVENFLDDMTAGGVALSIISAWCGPDGDLISNDDVEKAVDVAPEKLRGFISVDLNDPMGAVREIRDRSKSGKFVGVRIVPWLWGLPPNDRRYYPVYAACIDAGLPFCTQIGHTGPLKSSEPGRPIPYLEDVFLEFPELVAVGGHVGFPWISEVVSLVHKFPNFYLDTSAYALHRLPEDFVRLMKNEGKSRVMFGTNWPMLNASRCLAKIDSLELDDQTKASFLGGNAKRVFKL